MWFRVPLLRCFAFYWPHWRILLVATSVMAVANLLMPLTFVILGQALTDLKSGAGVNAAWHWSVALLALAAGRVDEPTRETLRQIRLRLVTTRVLE